MNKFALFISTIFSISAIALPSQASQYKNYSAQRCLNVPGPSSNGSYFNRPVTLYDCGTSGDYEQQWVSSPNGNIYKLLKLKADLNQCLNTQSGGVNQLTTTYTCIQGDVGQMFDFEAGYGGKGSNTGRLQFAGKGVCLQAHKANNFTPFWANYDSVDGQSCNNSNDQLWIKIGND